MTTVPTQGPLRLPAQAVDHALAWILSHPKFFGQGWGDLGLLAEVARRFLDIPPPRPIEVRWLELPYTESGITRMTGYFESPVRDLPLPAASRAGYFELLLPEGASPAIRPPVCLHLAATGDQGLGRRRRFAAPLVRAGIGALLLENPYYGLRRPADQTAVALQSVADQFMMNYATVQESRALLAWLRDGGFDHVGLSGYSMGGFMSSYVAALSEEPVAVVPAAAGISAAQVFTASPLANFPNWRVLGEGEEDPRARMRELLDMFSLDRLPKPVDPDLAIVLGPRHDSIVTPDSVARLARHWGAELRWTDGGHFSSYFARTRAMHEAIKDAFGTLMVREAYNT